MVTVGGPGENGGSLLLGLQADWLESGVSSGHNTSPSCNVYVTHCTALTIYIFILNIV